MKIGFHASQEQFSPSHLLKLAQSAEIAGFEAVLSSDHFHPWSQKQGESGFTWSWLGAAMQATNLEFGTVNSPGQRYHPAIIAQAVATLCNLFPDRFFYCAGSGEALNENITGGKWSPKEVRNQRLFESVSIMRQLWQGKHVTHSGLVQIENAKLFSLPKKKPKVYRAALSEKTAKWLSSWADGLITVSQSMEELKKIVRAFQNGKQKPMILKMQVSYSITEEKALEGAFEQWRNNIFPGEINQNLSSVSQFDILGETVNKEELKKHVLVSNKAEAFIEKIKAYGELGFERIIIHNVNRKQEDFIRFFGTHVLPLIKRK